MRQHREARPSCQNRAQTPWVLGSGIPFAFDLRIPTKPITSINTIQSRFIFRFPPSFSCSCTVALVVYMMGKSDAEVIALFNEQVNMTADELEKWLEDPQSRDAGTGVGIESGRRIAEILRRARPRIPMRTMRCVPAPNNKSYTCSNFFPFSLLVETTASGTEFFWAGRHCAYAESG